MNTKREIEKLKYKARKAHQRFFRARDGLECGNHMAKVISLAASEAARDFNTAVEQLEKLDPSCPPGSRL